MLLQPYGTYKYYAHPQTLNNISLISRSSWRDQGVSKESKLLNIPITH